MIASIYNIPRHLLVFIFVIVVMNIDGQQVSAQAFSGHETDAPVEFDAGDIDVEDRQKRVVLAGGVTVKQAGMTVRSPRMLVNYNDESALTISRITAVGGVSVRRGDETANGDVAIYDLERRIITLTGSVSLDRRGNSLRGDRLTINLASGLASLDGQGSSNAEGNTSRVSGTFIVSTEQ